MVNVPHGLPFECIDDHQTHHGQQNDHDQQDSTSETNPPTLPISSRAIWPRIFRRGAWSEQNDEVLHGAAEHGAEEDPEVPGKIAELRGQGGTHQRAGSGDGGEVVAEEDPFVGGLEIHAVAQTFGGGGAPVVEQP